MTAAVMLGEFNIYYDKVAGLDAPSITPTEAYKILSKAQERFVKTRYNPFGNKYRKGYEYDEKRRKDLIELTKAVKIDGADITDASAIFPNAYYTNLPSDFLWSVGEEGTVGYTDCLDTATTARASIDPVTHDEYNANINNPFKKPYEGDKGALAWRLDISRATAGAGVQRHIIVTGGGTLTEYYLRYISRPVDISASQNCLLDESTHREIVDIAVNIALENTQEPRWQSNKIENQGNE